jgi:ABC-2 type transport system ATP-binding protein
MLATQPEIESVSSLKPKLKVTLKPGVTDASEIATRLIQSGIAIRHFAEEEINLESAFMALTKGAGAKI